MNGASIAKVVEVPAVHCMVWSDQFLRPGNFSKVAREAEEEKMQSLVWPTVSTILTHKCHFAGLAGHAS